MKKIVFVLCFMTTLGGCAHISVPTRAGECTEEHPVKGNADSYLYHMRTSAFYGKVKAEWCFSSAEAAERSGYYPANR